MNKGTEAANLMAVAGALFYLGRVKVDSRSKGGGGFRR